MINTSCKIKIKKKKKHILFYVILTHISLLYIYVIDDLAIFSHC